MSNTQGKLIVPLDFSAGSANSLKLAKKFAKTYDSEIVLLYCIEPPHSLMEVLDREDYERKQEVVAEKRMDAIIKKNVDEGIRMSKMFERGRPHKAIAQVASNTRAEMLIMGTQGNSSSNELSLGTNTNRVIKNATCPVITTKGSFETKEINKVLIPVDRSFGIRELRDFLATYSRNQEIEIDLLGVTKKGEEEESELFSFLNKEKALLNKAGYDKVNSHVIKNESISQGIVEYIQENQENIDIVMMETHGRSGIASFFAGSVTEDVIAFSPKPVLSFKPERSGPSYKQRNSLFMG